MLDSYRETLAAAHAAGWDSVLVYPEGGGLTTGGPGAAVADRGGLSTPSAELPPALVRRLAALSGRMRIVHTPCSGCTGGRQELEGPCLSPGAARDRRQVLIRPVSPGGLSAAAEIGAPGCPGGHRPPVWRTADSAGAVRAVASSGDALLECGGVALPAVCARLELFRAARYFLRLPPPEYVPVVCEVTYRPSGGEGGCVGALLSVCEAGAPVRYAEEAGGTQACLRDLQEVVHPTGATELLIRLRAPVPLLPAAVRLLSSEILPHLRASPSPPSPTGATWPARPPPRQPGTASSNARTTSYCCTACDAPPTGSRT